MTRIAPNWLDESLLSVSSAARRRGFHHPPFSALAAARQYAPLIKITEESFPKGGRVLDWGCGHGFYSHLLLQMGFSVAAYEFHEPALLPELTALGGVRYEFVRAQEPKMLPFASDSFSGVASIGVLEHVRETGGDERGSLGELFRVLRPGGRLVCFHFPNKGSWIDSLSRRTRHGGHPYLYDRDDVCRLLADAGFELERLDRYGMVPRNTLGRLPARVMNSPRVADHLDALDRVLTDALGQYSQNWAFVAAATKR